MSVFSQTHTPEQIAFPKLNDSQLVSLKACAHPKFYKDGEYCYHEGETGYGLLVVVKGAIGIYDNSQGQARRVATHQAGEFAGDIDLLTGRPSVIDARADGDCEAFEIDRPCLRKIIARSPELGELFLKAFLMRRQLLQKQGYVGFKIIGSKWSADTLRLISFAVKNHVAYTWLDLDLSPEVDAILTDLGLCAEDTPVVLFNAAHLLKNPSDETLAEHLGIANVDTSEVFDLLIVGAGPAGLAAAVYGASEGLKTLVLDANAVGGQAGTSSKIENYLGFPYGISGQELADKALLQAERFGVTFAAPRSAMKLQSEGQAFSVEMNNHERVRARSVIIASGIQYKRLPVENIEKFENAGIFYGATQTEASYCDNEEVAIIGGGNSAGQATVFLAARAKKVYLIIRGKDLAKSMSRYLISRIEGLKNVEVLEETELSGLDGGKHLENIRVVQGPERKEKTFPIKNLFIFIGAIPCTDWLKDSIALDDKGFIRTGSALSPAELKELKWPLERSPSLLETCLPGVFAAGDVRAGSIKRVSTSVGEGAMAVALVHQSLSAST